MSDDPTLVRQVKQALKKERHEGEDRHSSPPDYAKWLPLLLAIIGGTAWAVRLEGIALANEKAAARVEKAHDKDMANYLEWNKTISERLRDLERGR